MKNNSKAPICASPLHAPQPALAPQTAQRPQQPPALSLTHFAASMSHEIRTPLNAIVGLAQLALNDDMPPATREHLQKIQRASSHLAMLMEDVLDFTHAQAGTLQLHQADFKLRPSLEASVDVIRQMCRSHGLDLFVQVAPELPKSLVGDAARLGQMLLNGAALMAQLAGEDDRVELGVRMASRSADDLLLVFELRRAGVLLPAREIARLLQGPGPGALPPQRDVGFGLALCGQLAALMGGELGIDSEAGEGTALWFTARLRLAAAAGAEVAEFDGPPEAIAGLRVLVVEDDLLAREVLTQLLELAQVRVRAAAHGAEALAALQADPAGCDLVLMDIQMPVMDGLEATRRIRADARWAALPVIALTGNVLEKDRADCWAAGASDFLSKPVDAGKLWSALAHWAPGSRTPA
ncbi:response regulator [Ramlibacter rhizophilus]|uniref:response regulator n=1 Tax=Ramlibacter rhizophilus TaxID=1781167 RepID=UPI0014324206|nr:response regulator [Ramlibacter rhizophilus]